MATIKYSLSGRGEKCSIRISFVSGRNINFKAPTGLYTQRKYWSFDKDGRNNGRFLNSIQAPEKRIKKKLQELTSYLENQFNEDNANGKPINAHWLTNQIEVFFQRTSPTGKSELVIDAIDNLIEDADVRKNQKGGIGLSKSRINDYKALKRIWGEFEGKEPKKVKEVNIPLSKKFLGFMLKCKKYQLGYAKRMMGNLKTVCYDAQIAEIATHPQLKKIDAAQIKNDYIIYLTPDELEQIKNAPLVGDGQINARKWLLLGCAIGQRGNDLLNLNKSNLGEINGMPILTLKQQKTAKTVEIPLLPDALEQLENGFPRKISLVKFNEHIKTIAKNAGIDQPTEGILNNPETNRKENGVYPKWQLLASHVCRRSFCSNLYTKLPTPIIMEVTGHSSEKSFLKYIGKKGMDYSQEWKQLIQNQKENRKTKMEVIRETANV